MTEPEDEVEIECWWETATIMLDLDSAALDALGEMDPQAQDGE